MVLDENSRRIVSEKLSEMQETIRLYYFHDSDSELCPYCKPTLEFLQELSELSRGKLELIIYERGINDDKFKEYNIKKAPVIIVDQYDIRYLGAPVGQETWAFIETLVAASNKIPKLSKRAIESLKNVKDKIKIEVIVTPSCPWCPYAALMSNSAAIVSENISSDIVEAYEFPEIADTYGVTAVPTVAINGKVAFVGVPQEEAFIKNLTKL